MDETALKAQLEACHGESFAWALSCCRGNRSDAEDLLQAVYLKVLAEKARFDGRSEFKTWFFAVIRKTAAAEARKQMLRRLLLFQHEQQRTWEPTVSGPDASLDALDLRGLFRQALNNLPARQREVLHLVFYQDSTINEAAAVMGVSLGAARQHYERGKANLRQKLHPELEDRSHGRRSE